MSKLNKLMLLALIAGTPALTVAQDSTAADPQVQQAADAADEQDKGEWGWIGLLGLAGLLGLKRRDPDTVRARP